MAAQPMNMRKRLLTTLEDEKESNKRSIVSTSKCRFPQLEEIPDIPTFKPNETTEMLLRGCQHILLLKNPVESNPNGFYSELMFPMNSKLAMILSYDIKYELRLLVEKVITDFLQHIGHRMRSSASSGHALLREYGRLWKNFNISKACLRMIFGGLYISRPVNQFNYGVSTEQIELAKRALVDKCGFLWKSEMIDTCSTTIHAVVDTLMFRMRQAAEAGEAIDPVDVSTIKDTASSYIEYDSNSKDFYKQTWETPVLKATETFYSERASCLMAESNVSHYLEFCKKMIGFEESTIFQFLDTSSRKPLLTTLYRVLILSDIQMLNNSLDELFLFNKKKELGILYELYTRMREVCEGGNSTSIESLIGLFISVFRTFMETRLKKIFTDLAAVQSTTQPNAFAHQYATNFLTIYYQLEDMIKECFQSNPSFVQSLEAAAYSVINNNEIHDPRNGQERSARLITKYADLFLADPKLSLTDLQSNRLYIPGLQLLYGLLESKDVFCNVYQIHLMNRLLKPKQPNRDAELAMVGILKTKVDLQYAQQLTTMLQDVDQSRSTWGSFQDGEVLVEPIILTAAST